jgi:hypothetical protein
VADDHEHDAASAATTPPPPIRAGLAVQPADAVTRGLEGGDVVVVRVRDI